MGVTTQLEVYAGTFSLFQMVGLMVEQDAVFTGVGPLQQFVQIRAMRVGAVITSNDAQVFEHYTGILQ